MTDHDIVHCIKSFWRERGYNVKAAIIDCLEPGRNGGGVRYQAIRSDMRGGLPLGYNGDREPVRDWQANQRVGNG